MKKISKKSIKQNPELEFFNFCKRIHVSHAFMSSVVIKSINETSLSRAKQFVKRIKKKKLSKIDKEILYINYWLKLWNLFDKNCKISFIKHYQICYKEYQQKLIKEVESYV